MRALRLEQGDLRLEDVPSPDLDPGEALIRVSLAGICSTDLELVAGYYPFEGTLGHEFVGVVESAPDASEWEGRRIVATINISPDCNGSCGAERCPEHCPDRTVLGIAGRDGCFAEKVAVPVANLLEVPASLSDEEAVFAEPLAAACRIPEQLPSSPDAIVIGPGRLGMLVAQVLRHEGMRVEVLGRSEESLELPRQLGFRAHGTAAELQPAGLVVETTANPEGLRAAAALVKPQGILVLKSTYADACGAFEGFAPVLATLVVNEVTVVGSRCGPFERALELLAVGAIETGGLIERTVPLEDGVDAFAEAAKSGVRKILLRP